MNRNCLVPNPTLFGRMENGRSMTVHWDGLLGRTWKETLEATEWLSLINDDHATAMQRSSKQRFEYL
jgi:hypothetical protein